MVPKILFSKLVVPKFLVNQLLVYKLFSSWTMVRTIRSLTFCSQLWATQQLHWLPNSWFRNYGFPNYLVQKLSVLELLVPKLLVPILYWFQTIWFTNGWLSSIRLKLLVPKLCTDSQAKNWSTTCTISGLPNQNVAALPNHSLIGSAGVCIKNTRTAH